MKPTLETIVRTLSQKVAPEVKTIFHAPFHHLGFTAFWGILAPLQMSTQRTPSSSEVLSYLGIGLAADIAYYILVSRQEKGTPEDEQKIGIMPWFDKPYGITITAAVGGLAGTSTTGKLSPFLIGTGLGLIGDLARYGSASIRRRLWKKSPSHLEKILGREYINQLLQQVRKQYNIYDSRPIQIEATGRNQGTGLFQGGYFTELSLLFESGKKLKFLYKYNTKPTLRTGGEAMSVLRKLGCADFVPNSFALQDFFTYKPRFFPTTYVRQGQLYEFVPGDSLENTCLAGSKPTVDAQNLPRDLVSSLFFDKMARVYTLTSRLTDNRQNALINNIAKHTFHDKLLRELNQSRLVETLKESYAAEFERQPLALVHGDLHQGNIIAEDSGKLHLIDWDNAQWGLPYHDFVHFGVISDLERDPSYPALQDQFLAFQKSLLSSTRPGQLHLTELEVYLSLLHRYYNALEEDKIKDEFKPTFLSSCKYLLVRGQQILEEYGNSELIDSYEKYQQEHFPLLTAVNFNPLASVAYAHRVNSRERKSRNGQTEANIHAHLKQIESIVVKEDYHKNLILGDLGILSVLYGALVASYFLTPHKNLVEKNSYEALLTLGGITLGVGFVGTLFKYHSPFKRK